MDTILAFEPYAIKMTSPVAHHVSSWSDASSPSGLSAPPYYSY